MYTIKDFLNGCPRSTFPEFVVFMDYNFNRLAFKVNDEFLNSYYYNELTGHSANWERWHFDNAGRISLLGDLKVTLVARVEKVPICKIDMD